MRMTRLAIEKLLQELADDFELPLSKEQREFHALQSKRGDIPMRECWDHEDKLRMDLCYCAIEKLLRRVPKNARL